jgi:hypothetical protein
MANFKSNLRTLLRDLHMPYDPSLIPLHHPKDFLLDW